MIYDYKIISLIMISYGSVLLIFSELCLDLFLSAHTFMIRTHTGGSIEALFGGRQGGRSPRPDPNPRSISQIHRIIGTGSAIKGSRFAIFKAQAQLRVENAHFVDEAEIDGNATHTTHSHTHTSSSIKRPAFCYCLTGNGDGNWSKRINDSNSICGPHRSLFDH